MRKITGKITGSQEDNRVRLEADRVEADRVEADRVNPAILRYSRYSVVSSQRPAWLAVTLPPYKPSEAKETSN